MEREISIPRPTEARTTRRAFVRRLAGALAGATVIPSLYYLEQSAGGEASYDQALTQATGFSLKEREEVIDCSKPAGTRHDTLTDQNHCSIPIIETPYPVALQQILAAENLPDILTMQQQATRKYILGAGGLGLTAVFALFAIALKDTASEETL